jgi:hypothetical protein
VVLTKSGCPSVDVVPVGGATGDVDSCRRWRDRALAWLQDHPPTLVVVSNSGDYGVSGSDWEAGLRATLAELPSRSRAVVIADTPRSRRSPADCLRRHRADMSRCVTSRDAAIAAGHAHRERDVAQSLGAAFVDLSDLVCPYDPCPVVVGRTLMWRDDDHLSRTFSRQLAPSMASRIANALR